MLTKCAILFLSLFSMASTTFHIAPALEQCDSAIPCRGWGSNAPLLKSGLVLVTHLEPTECSEAAVAGIPRPGQKKPSLGALTLLLRSSLWEPQLILGFPRRPERSHVAWTVLAEPRF